MMKYILKMTGQNAAKITVRPAVLVMINYILKTAGMTIICLAMMAMII